MRLTNPDKVYFPEPGHHQARGGEYYRAVAEPAAAACCASGRPTSSATPTASTGEAFYAKRLPKGAPPYAETATVTFPSGRTAEAFCPTEQAVLVWAANLGTFDFHPWPVRRADPDRPDELRIDLDPQPGTDFADAVAVAAVLREVLDEAGLVGLAEDLGRARDPRFVRIRPEWDVRRRPARGDRDRRGGWPSGCRTGPPWRGGRRSAASACSSTTTRPHATARSRRRGRCAAGRGRRSRCR